MAKTHLVRLIIVRDLPLAPAAVMIGRILRIPVVLDMAECYPELIRAVWQFEPFRPENLVVRNPVAAEAVERAGLRLVDHVFCMVEESRQRLVARGVPEERLSIVSNTPLLQEVDATPLVRRSPGARGNDHLVLVYIGYLNWSRGLEFVLRAMRTYLERNGRVRLELLEPGTQSLRSGS